MPGTCHGQRSLAGYSPRGGKELDMTEQPNQQQEKVLGRETPGIGSRKSGSSPAYRGEGLRGVQEQSDQKGCAGRTTRQELGLPVKEVLGLQHYRRELAGEAYSLTWFFSLTLIFHWCMSLSGISTDPRARKRFDVQEAERRTWRMLPTG